MTAGRFVIVVLAFVAGFTTASIVPRRKAVEPLDYSQPIKIVVTSDPHDPRSMEYVSHRVVIDGQGRDVRPFRHREGAEVLRVDIAGGRVVLFGTRRPLE